MQIAIIEMYWNRVVSILHLLRKQQGAERSDHWPNRCQLLTHALKEYHDTQSRTGHTDHQGNTSGQH